MIKNLELEEMPREKLIKFGPQILTEIELLAILLRTGTKEKGVLELSREVLNRFNIAQVSRKTFEELIQFKGIKKAKAAQIVAAFEFARRTTQKEEKVVLKSSQEVSKYVQTDFDHLSNEKVMGIFVNSKNMVLKKEFLHEGSINYSIIEPRLIVKKVLDYGASGFFLLHNHPSGDSNPSQEDIEITQRLALLCEQLDIRFLDHIIIGENPYSFSDNGVL